MVKVLHFVSTLSIGSGVMSVIMNYYRHMDRSKVQFDFLCFIPCEDSYEDEIKKLGGHVFFIPKPRVSVKSLCEIREFFSKYGKDYTFLHNHEIYLSVILKPLAKKYHIPHFIIHCHATQYSERKIGAIRNAILCIPIRFMECERFACSKAAGEFLYGDKMLQNGKVLILYNAIESEAYRFDPEKRIQIRTELGVREGHVVLGHVGRFAKQKNHKFLINIFYEFQKKISDSKLVCIGEGPLQHEIRKQVEELGILEKVLFLGHCSNVQDLLNGMDVFLLPSLFEGFPVSLVEAESNGLNCLISDTISDEMKSEQIYRLSLNQSPEKWAEKILELLTMKRNGKRGRVEYDIGQQAKILQAFYLNSVK